MTNWKTSLGGLLTALGTIGVFGGLASDPTTADAINKALVATGAVVMGLAAKDKDVTGVGVNARRE